MIYFTALCTGLLFMGAGAHIQNDDNAVGGLCALLGLIGLSLLVFA